MGSLHLPPPPPPAEAEAELARASRQDSFPLPDFASSLDLGCSYQQQQQQQQQQHRQSRSGCASEYHSGDGMSVAGPSTHQGGSNGYPGVKSEQIRGPGVDAPPLASGSSSAVVTHKRPKKERSSKERATVDADKGGAQGVKNKEATHQRHMWSVDETEALIAGCQKHGVGNWKAMLNDTDLRHRFSADRNPGDLKDRFRTKFPQAYAELYPNAKTHIPSRTLSEGTSKSPFEKGQSKERRSFSPAEDVVLKQGFALHGSSWTIIARDPVFGGRRKPTDLRDRFRNAWPQEYADAGYSARRKAGGTGGSATSKGSAKSRERTLSHGSSRQFHSHHDHAVPLPSANGDLAIDDDLQGIFVRGPDGKPTLARSASSTSASASSSSNTTFGLSESEVESDSEGLVARGGVDFAWLRDTAGYGMPSPREGYNGAHQLGTASPLSLQPDFARSLSFGSVAAGPARPTFNTHISSSLGMMNSGNGSSTTTSGVGLGVGGVATFQQGSASDQRNRLAEWHPEPATGQGGRTEHGANMNLGNQSGSNDGSGLGGFSPPFSSAAGHFSPSLSLGLAGPAQNFPPPQATPNLFDPNAIDFSSIGGAQLQQINQLLQSYVQHTGRGEESEQQPPSSASYRGGEVSSGYASESDGFSADGWASDQGGSIGLESHEMEAPGQSAFQESWPMDQTDPYATATYSSMGMNSLSASTDGAEYALGDSELAQSMFIGGDTPINEPSSALGPNDGLDFQGEQRHSAHHQGQHQHQQWPLATLPSVVSDDPYVDLMSSSRSSQADPCDVGWLRPSLSLAPSNEDQSEAGVLELDSNWHEEGYEEDEEPDDEEDEEDEEEGEDEDSDDRLPRSNTIRPAANRPSSEDDDHDRLVALLFHQQQQQRQWESRNAEGYASDSSLVSTPEGGSSSYASSVHQEEQELTSRIPAAAAAGGGRSVAQAGSTEEGLYVASDEAAVECAQRSRMAHVQPHPDGVVQRHQQQQQQQQQQGNTHQPLDGLHLDLDLGLPTPLGGSVAMDPQEPNRSTVSTGSGGGGGGGGGGDKSSRSSNSSSSSSGPKRQGSQLDS